jgi:D-cysteine desulfhydrase
MDSVLFLCGTEPPDITGNLFLDRLAGAEIRFVTPQQYEQRAALLPEAAAVLRATGRRPYVIPEGGSNALGSWGYVQLVAELAADAEAPWDHVVCATGSGGTLAGLVLGRRLLAPLVPWLETTRMWGVPVRDDGPYFQAKVMEIAREFQERFVPESAAGPARRRSALARPGSAPGGTGSKGVGDRAGGESSICFPAEEIGVLDGYKGPAYAVPYAEEIALIQQVARVDGIFLDPVYTGKAFYGLVSEARKGRFLPGERVLFLHTGGIFSLFAFAEELLR